ncbi:ATP-binding protein, partial [Staphylococcus aureus]|nr:ATP-binding protein [Staphylococcus aureus]
IDRDDINSYEYNRQFALENNIDLTSPFLNLYSKHEQVEVARKMIEKFDLLELEKEDYGFAAAAGVIAGFIDVVFVGTIAKGKDAKGLQKV